MLVHLKRVSSLRGHASFSHMTPPARFSCQHQVEKAEFAPEGCALGPSRVAATLAPRYTRRTNPPSTAPSQATTIVTSRTRFSIPAPLRSI
jgi:hypothetical protein